MKCPKCEGEMEKGLLLAPGAGVRWNKGELSGIAKLTGAVLFGKPMIHSFRCVKCGFLENYAR